MHYLLSQIILQGRIKEEIYEAHIFIKIDQYNTIKIFMMHDDNASFSSYEFYVT